MIIYNKKILASILFILISFVCMATQVVESAGPPEPQAMGGPIPPGFPIDNGLIILFVAAIIYGIYRILKFSKPQSQA